MYKKQIVIDGKGHMMGRLASYVAKQLLSGIHYLINYRPKNRYCQMRIYQHFRITLQK